MVNPLGIPKDVYLESGVAAGTLVYERALASGFATKYESLKITILQSSQLERQDLCKLLYSNLDRKKYQGLFPHIENTKDSEGNYQISLLMSRPPANDLSFGTTVAALGNAVQAVAQPVLAQAQPQVVEAPGELAALQAQLFERAPTSEEFAKLCEKYPAVASRALDLYPEVAPGVSADLIGRLSTRFSCQALLVKLIDKGATVTGTHLLNALHYGLVEAAKKLIEHGVDLTARDQKLNTPLHLATQKGLNSIVQALLQKEVDVYKKNAFNETPISLAKKHGDQAMQALFHKYEFSFLLEQGDKEKMQQFLSQKMDLSKEEMMALWVKFPELALNSNYKDMAKLCPLSALEWLLAREDGVTHVDKLLSKGLEFKSEDFLSLCQKFPEKIRTLVLEQPKLAKKCTLDVLDGLYTLPNTEELICALIDEHALTEASHLHLALTNNKLKAAEKLIAKVDLSQDNSGCGQTPLFFAILLNNDVLVRKMLEAGAIANQQDSHKMTPLHYAVQQGNAQIVTLLLQKGADVFTKNTDGLTARDLARAANMTELARELGKVELDKAIDLGDEEQIKKLINENLHLSKLGYCTLCKKFPQIALELADTQVETITNFSLNDLQSFSGSQETDQLVLKFLELGLNPLTSDPVTKRTLLHATCSAGFRTASAKLLETDGVDVHAKDKDGITPLHEAVKSSRSIVRKLLDKGANINEADNNGDVPLHYAAIAGRTKIVRELVTRGADKLALNNLHQPPLASAINSGHSRSVKVLLEGSPQPFVDKILKEIEESKDYTAVTLSFLTLNDPRLTRSCCTATTTPFEVAFLLNNAKIAENCMRHLSNEDRLHGIELLCAKYPKHIGRFLDTFFKVDHSHLKVGNLSLMNATPIDVGQQNLNTLEDLFMEVMAQKPNQKIKVDGREKTPQKVKEAVAYYLNKVNTEEHFTATPDPTTPAFKEQYKLVRDSLSNVLVYLQKTKTEIQQIEDVEKKAKAQKVYEQNVISIATELAFAAYYCFIQYRAAAGTLYQKYCLGIDPTMENAMLQQLQMLRGIIVESMTDESYVCQGQGVHAVKYMKAMLGQELQLIDAAQNADLNRYDSCGFKNAPPTQETLLASFHKRYNPAVIFDHFKGSLADEQARSVYLSWARSHLKRYVEGQEEHKKKKLALQQKQNELFKKALTAPLSVETIANYKSELEALTSELGVEPLWGQTPVQSLQEERSEAISKWVLDDTLVAKPFPLILTLLEQKVLTFK